jgi:PAS domain S-box-containing protein
MEIDKDIMCEECLSSLVLDSVPLYIFWKDKNHVFMGCNENFADFVGLNDPSEIVGKTDFDILSKEKAEHFLKIDKSVMEKREILNDLTEETENINGEKFWINITKIPLIEKTPEGQGDVVGIIGVFEDITEKMELENKLSIQEKELNESKIKLDKSEEKYKDLINFTGTSYIIMDTDLTIIDVNDIFTQLIESDSKCELN